MPAYAKAIAAAIGAGLTAAISYYPHVGWMPVAAAICTLLSVYAMPNVPKESPSQVLPKVAEVPQASTDLVFHGLDCPGHTSGIPGQSCMNSTLTDQSYEDAKNLTSFTERVGI